MTASNLWLTESCRRQRQLHGRINRVTAVPIAWFFVLSEPRIRQHEWVGSGEKKEHPRGKPTRGPADEVGSYAEVSMSKRSPRKKRSGTFVSAGKHTVRHADDIRLAAVLHTRRADVIEAVTAAADDRTVFVVVRDRREIGAAMARLTAATVFAIGMDVEHPEQTTQMILERWVGSRCVWFLPHMHPAVPATPKVLREVTALDLRAMGSEETGRALVATMEVMLARRLWQLEAAREFAGLHELKGLSEAALALLALGVREPEKLLGQSAERFHKMCSTMLYPSVSVHDREELMNKFWTFAMHRCAERKAALP